MQISPITFWPAELVAPGVDVETLLLAEPWCGRLRGKHKTQSSPWMKQGFSPIEKKQSKVRFSCGNQCHLTSWILYTSCTHPFCVTAEGPWTLPQRARYGRCPRYGSGVAQVQVMPAHQQNRGTHSVWSRDRCSYRIWSFQPGLWGLFIWR